MACSENTGDPHQTYRYLPHFVDVRRDWWPPRWQQIPYKQIRCFWALPITNSADNVMQAIMRLLDCKQGDQDILTRII